MSWPPDRDEMTAMAGTITRATADMRTDGGPKWLLPLAEWLDLFGAELVRKAGSWGDLISTADSRTAYGVAVAYLDDLAKRGTR